MKRTFKRELFAMSVADTKDFKDLSLADIQKQKNHDN